MTVRLFPATLLLVPLIPILAACSPATPEEVRASDIVRCEEQYGPMVIDPVKTDALCNCLVDRLDEREMVMADLFGSRAEEVKAVAAICAREVGIPQG